MDNNVEKRRQQLKAKNICRFCLGTEGLFPIHGKDSQSKSDVPLPMQIISCVSIEVFSSDEMPSTICNRCSDIMDFCYRFKQMCKNADTLLRQFPLTGEWPPPMELPKLSQELDMILSPKASPVSAKPLVAVIKKEKILNKSLTPKKMEVITLEEITAPDLIIKEKPRLLNSTMAQVIEPIMLETLDEAEIGEQQFVLMDIIEDDAPPAEPVPVETDVFPCEYCDRSYPLKQLLDIHRDIHTREREHACSECDKRFLSKYDLRKHMPTHTGEKPFVCVHCNKAFSRSTLLYRHQLIHTDATKYECSFCPRFFLSSEELEKHNLNHTKRRPYQCKFCDKSFAYKQGLERHEVIHLADQPFKCQYCAESFNSANKLARHVTTHAGKRPYPCRICSKSYLLSHHLTRHMRSHANAQEGGMYKCTECQEFFTDRNDFIYHSAVHATESFLCPLCKEQFQDLQATTAHIEQHTNGEQFACEFCDLIFISEENLADHHLADHMVEQKLYDEDVANNVRIVDAEGEIYAVEEVEEKDKRSTKRKTAPRTVKEEKINVDDDDYNHSLEEESEEEVVVKKRTYTKRNTPNPKPKKQLAMDEFVVSNKKPAKPKQTDQITEYKFIDGKKIKVQQIIVPKSQMAQIAKGK